MSTDFDALSSSITQQAQQVSYALKNYSVLSIDYNRERALKMISHLIDIANNTRIAIDEDNKHKETSTP